MITPSRHSERGQTMVLFAVLLPILLGMAALAVDVGGWASHRRTLQNAADSIALAAAQDLPNASTAQAAGEAWATKNGIPADSVTIIVTPASTTSPNPSVTVEITRPHGFAFMPVLGVQSHDVEARAVAIKTSPGGAAQVVPWGILEATRDASEPGDLITLKYDSNNVESGNFGALRLDGNGSSTYEDSIQNGSSSTVCAEGIESCTETSPVCSGAVCETETGNKVSATRNGVDYRMDNTDAACDEFTKVFSGPVDGKYSMTADCNPWIEGGYDSYRIILVPIIDSLCPGSCSVTITEFALFWLEGYGSEKCTGSSCEIQGRFVDADVSVEALTGAYDSSSSVHFVKLTE